MFPADVTRIAFLGDLHRNFAAAEKGIRVAHQEQADIIIQVGDLGFETPDMGFMQGINDLCQQYGMLFLFIDGNHENHDNLDKLPIDDDGVRRITEWVWHLPRGYRWEWLGVRFLALGGAHSVDMETRREGVDWFKQEQIDIPTAARVIQAGETDVAILHDAPNGAVPLPVAHGFPQHQVDAAEAHRGLVYQILKEVKANYIFHGHYHHAHGRKVRIGNKEVYVRGLGRDKQPVDQYVVVVDVIDFI